MTTSDRTWTPTPPEEHSGETHDGTDRPRIRLESERHEIEHLREELDRAERSIASLEVALVTARRIGAAIGVLMATLKVPEQDAFNLLKKASQTRHRKLRDIADDVVRTGVLE